MQHLESRLLCFGFLNVGCFSFQLSSLQASMLQLLVVSLLLKLCWGLFVQRTHPHLQLPWLYWLLLSRQLYLMFYRGPNQLLQYPSMIWNLLLVLFLNLVVYIIYGFGLSSYLPFQICYLIFYPMRRNCCTFSAEFIVDCIDEVNDTFFLGGFCWKYCIYELWKVLLTSQFHIF